MTTDYANRIAADLNLAPRSVAATIALLNEGATVPFISRYRKEATNSLDEVQITDIRDLLQRLIDLDKRRESILSSLTERSLLTDELKKRIDDALTMTELEDIYLPFKVKRKTRATAAREKGLEPLAQAIFVYSCKNPAESAQEYISEEKGVATADDALAGARDIMAEWINEDDQTRKQMRRLWFQKSVISSKLAKKGTEEAAEKFKDYFSSSEPTTKIPSHRILALFRGEKEGLLKVSIEPEEIPALVIMESKFLKGAKSPCGVEINKAIQDCYKRLLAPSMETEVRADLKDIADAEAIHVFSTNLRELLMSPPLGEKNVLAVDPGFRTGCKIVCLNKQGELKYNDVIYPHEDKKVPDAQKKIIDLIKKYEIEAIALGNGTASRESESFLKSIDYDAAGVAAPPIVLVNESGASIYSASPVAREEFPDHDVTVRGAISIGRRLVDPLAELVKIDAKSIGVGQYQHDVDQSELQKSLDDTVSSCVNSVGVELNTASKELLSFVSGLGPQLAGNIIKHRNENGPFKSRSELKKVPRLGAKAYEQCAGFLRIRNAKNPLDSSAVHPERYELVQQMAKDVAHKLEDLIANSEVRKKIDVSKYVSESVGLPTLKDILSELEKPGRDPREKLVPMQFKEGVNKMEDLREGMKLPGIVTNVTAFGAFVDIGVHQDGLVHVSELANKFIKDPAEVVKVHQRVDVTVLSVDKDRKRIGLSMKR
ncbi:MAG: Tex family protein [Candidatus Melainabacteria bacterium]|nr:Tex family protein [Candidatus Melainabacteria bacterium]